MRPVAKSVALSTFAALFIAILTTVAYLPITESEGAMLAQDDEALYWHHDCSNLTAFDGIGDDTWLWTGAVPMLSSSGMMNSAAGAIYSSDLGTPPSVRCWFGPIRYHTFSSPFNLLQLHQLEVEMEIENGGVDAACGGAMIMLHNDSHAPIVGIRISDPYSADSNIHPRAIWFYSNGTEGYQPSDATTGYIYTPSSFRDSVQLELNSTGIYVILPVFGYFKVIDAEEIGNPIVSHISITIHGSKNAYVPPQPFPDTVRIHDIELLWSPEYTPPTTATTEPSTTTSPSAETSTTTSTSMTPLPTNGTWNWSELPDPAQFLIVGMGGTILVLVIFIGCTRQQGGP
jgi:hypothetical protein